MNKIRTLRSKTSPENGLFSKITKRYSNVSSKFMNKSPKRKSVSPQKVTFGSYDMTGNGLEECKMEIGAPILISSTTIDTDRLDVNGRPLRVSSMVNSGNTVTAVASSESETDVYVDAVSSFQGVQDISFEFMPTTTVEINNREQIARNNSRLNKSDPTSELIPATYAVPRINRPVSLKKNRSKSAQNLHKSELRVYLQKAPSLELNLKLTTADLGNCYDLPRKTDETKEIKKHPSSPPTFSPPPPPVLSSTTFPLSPDLSSPPKSLMSTSEPTTPLCPTIDESDLVIHCESIESLQEKNYNVEKNASFSSNINVNNGSQSSVFNSSIEDFNMKSVSYQSLNAENLFLSIDELNEITRQINESEEFNKQVDYEYCEHRDGLKPSERRITLLKNKNTRLINLHHNKEKLNNAWSGLKNWIGEEKGRLKEVVQKHAAMQRVGGTTNDSNCNSNVLGTELKQSTNISRTLSQASKINGTENEDINRDIISCDNTSNLSTLKSSSDRTIIGGENSDILDDDNDLFHQKNQLHQREISSFSKRSKSKEKWKGQNGFEELRRYIKQGGDFGKDLMGILQERVDTEQLYAKSLSKMASKLNKTCREIPGTIADAWRGVAAEMESRSEVHRRFANSLIEEIVKPLKTLLDSQHKTRKTVESNVDKSARVLSEWRISEGKAKKASHSAARENEKLQDAILDVRIQKSPSIALLHQSNYQSNSGGSSISKSIAEKELKNAEKDCAKLDNKRRKAEEAVKRADIEYYTLCMRAERARVDWEMSVLRGSSVLQNLENVRLINMKNHASSYLRLTTDMNPVLERIVEQLTPHINACNVQKDVNVVKNIRRAAEGPSEQLLPDFYCEHTTLAMNRERRKHALVKLLQLVKTDLERERRSRNGLKGLSQTLNVHDNQNITDKLYHIRSMLTYLEGARFKLHSALLELDHKPRNSHPLAPHIQVTRDRTGLQQSILKVPLWLKNNDKMNNDNKDIDYELESQTDTNCIDIKNEILIKHFDKNFNRSKSSSEIIRGNAQQMMQQQRQQQQQQQQQQHQSTATTVCDNPKAQTLPIKDVDNLVFDRGIADGGSNQPDSDFDEFSSQDDEDDDDDIDNDNVGNGNNSTNKNIRNDNTSLIKDQPDNISGNTENSNLNENYNKKPIVISKCKALYSYTPKLYDELELNPGDIIEVHAKQEDGWWLGALRNQIGIFPATYVEEFI